MINWLPWDSQLAFNKKQTGRREWVNNKVIEKFGINFRKNDYIAIKLHNSVNSGANIFISENSMIQIQ